MRNKWMVSIGFSWVLGCLAWGVTGPARASDLLDFEGEDYETPAGALAFFECNPADSVYGLGFADQTWLKNAPILGDFFFTLFYNDLEEMTYLGFGLSLRLMPHWRVAPFVGGGGSLNLALADAKSNTEADETEEADPGASYGAGHVEAGVQWAQTEGVIEILARWVASSSELPESDYGLIRLGYGLRF